jgi:uncharacterized protein (TIGR02646 family)
MKKINKSPQPTKLQQWRAANAAIPGNLQYGCGGFPKGAVLSALLSEQGYLCAYTLLKIDESKAHIEHLKPRTMCRAEDDEREAQGTSRLCEDVDWRNMVACYPQSGAEHPGYGAVQKDKWWHETDFVSPLTQNCEARFRFEKDGKIKAAVSNDTAAQTTINKLKLDCERLKEVRKEAIMQAGLHKRAPKPIRSISKVERFIDNLKRVQSDGYIEFCTVLEQVAADYINVLRCHTQSRRHAAT